MIFRPKRFSGVLINAQLGFFYEIMDTGDVASIFCEVFTEQKVIRRPSNMIVNILNKYLR